MKLDIAFSLVFFFFASIFMLALLSSIAMNNFDNLIPIMLKEGGYFASFAKLFLLIGFVASIYYLISNLRKKREINKIVFLGISLIIVFFVILSLPDKYADEYENVLDIYSYTESRTMFNIVRNFLLDYLVFIAFIALPIVLFFAKQRAINYFERAHDFAPSMNISMIFLFGYIIEFHRESYGIFSIFDLLVCLFFIVLLFEISAKISTRASFYTIVNCVILSLGFIVVFFANSALKDSNTHYASMLFYSLGLLYWQANLIFRES